jgi:hypothetical protein
MAHIIEDIVEDIVENTEIENIEVDTHIKTVMMYQRKM